MFPDASSRLGRRWWVQAQKQDTQPKKAWTQVTQTGHKRIPYTCTTASAYVVWIAGASLALSCGFSPAHKAQAKKQQRSSKQRAHPLAKSPSHLPRPHPPHPRHTGTPPSSPHAKWQGVSFAAQHRRSCSYASSSSSPSPRPSSRPCPRPLPLPAAHVSSRHPRPSHHRLSRAFR